MLEIDISTPRCPNAILRIDECDAHLLEGVKWTPDKRSNGLIYAHRKIAGGKLYLHRLIMKPCRSLVVDHIDRDGLNNTRANLRVVRPAVNLWNRRGSGASRFKGVCRKRQKWAAEINGSFLGVFSSEEEAAVTYDAAALALGLDRTGLNFPSRNTAPRFEPVERQPNRLGVAGIRQLPSGRFNVRTMRDGHKVGLGTFDTFEAAEAALEGSR
jgi:hypothetical protein